MSAFSDSSASAMSSVQASPITTRAAPPGPLVNGSMPPPPVRKRPAAEMQTGAMEVEEPERAETSEEAEPSTTEEGDMDLPVRPVADVASDIPDAAAGVKMLEEDVVAEEVKEEPEQAATPARRGRASGRAATSSGRGRGRGRGLASTAPTVEDQDEADGEQETADDPEPAPKKQKTRGSSASVAGVAAEVSGIAATVKNRRRKAAKYT